MTSNSTKVVRLNGEGSVNKVFAPWTAVTHASVIEGSPKERSALFFEQMRDDPGNVRIGIWESTAYAEKIVDYDKDEFMVVLEGSCIIVDDDGSEEQFETGDAFFMPKGFTGIWRQTEPMKKYFAMVDYAQ
jgi:uncharacterized protein